MTIFVFLNQPFYYLKKNYKLFFENIFDDPDNPGIYRTKK